MKLFDDQPDWKSEWQDMPEFVQEQKQPFAQITIRFENEKDLEDFSRIIGQKLTKKTKSIWHPAKSHFTGASQKAWINE